MGVGFKWPFIRGDLMSWAGKGCDPIKIGFIWTQPLDEHENPIYCGEMFALPASPLVKDDHGYHYYIPVFADDVGDATERKEEPNAFQQKDHKSYEEIFGRG